MSTYRSSPLLMPIRVLLLLWLSGEFHAGRRTRFSNWPSHYLAGIRCLVCSRLRVLSGGTSSALTVWPIQPSDTGCRCRRRAPNVFRDNRPGWSHPRFEKTPENSDHAENRYGDSDDDRPDNDNSKQEEPHLALFGAISRLSIAPWITILYVPVADVP